MKLFFLPFAREGLRPSSAVSVRPRVDVSLSLTSPGRPARDLSRSFELLGPADVLGLDPKQVLSMSPARNARDAEVEMFPSIELDDADLPWAFSPAVPVGGRLVPWICLAVVEAQNGVAVERGDPGQSPFVLTLPRDVAARELPPLADVWAWSHVQVACASVGEVESTLAQHPDRTMSRLVCPRRLAPRRTYHACVVPTFAAGRAAGLGEASITNLAPAWSVSELPARLPVYFTWTFTTGDAGDFESLAQRMRPAPLDVSLPATPLRLSWPGATESIAVDFEPPLRVPGHAAERDPKPQAARVAIADSLAVATEPPGLGPSYFGETWLGERRLAPHPGWGAQLNGTPMFRAAAGLGAEIVRREQEALVAAAKEQLDAHRARQRTARAQLVAIAVTNRVKTRLARAPAPEAARVMAALSFRTDALRSDLGLYSVAGRRIAQKAAANRVAAPPRTPSTALDPVGAATATSVAGRTEPPSTGASSGGTAPPAGSVRRDHRTAVPALDAAVDAGRARPGDAAEVALGPELRFAAEVILDRVPLDLRPLAPVDPRTVSDGAFRPRFDRPMLEPLAERFAELVLPALGDLPNDAVMLVEPNASFIESYLVGANEELARELLWRGMPADPKATAFRRFFPREDADDIPDLAAWTPSSALGAHLSAPPALILLLRGELVRRYPSLILATVPARWAPDRTRAPDASAALTLPAFRGRIGADVLYAGFARPTPSEAVGAVDPTGAAGWFFLLAEHPGDPRFGLDPESSSPPTRDGLAWSHLSSATGTLHAQVSSFPALPEVGFAPASATSARLANVLRQRPFRAFLHGSTLMRPGG